MFAFAVVLLCVQAFLVQNVYSQYLGGAGLSYNGDYGLGASCLGGRYGLDIAGGVLDNGLLGGDTIYGNAGYGLLGGSALYGGVADGLLGWGAGYGGFDDGLFGSSLAYGGGLFGGDYGGSGIGDVSVTGELPVAGTTLITGNVPIIGTVGFEGTLPGSGAVSITGSCGCGCRGSYGY